MAAVLRDCLQVTRGFVVKLGKVGVGKSLRAMSNESVRLKAGVTVMVWVFAVNGERIF